MVDENMVDENEAILCSKCGNDKFVIQESIIGSLYIGCSECGEGNIFGGRIAARDIISILKGNMKIIEHKKLKCPFCSGNRFIENNFETDVDYPAAEDVRTETVLETDYICATCYTKHYSEVYGRWYDIDEEWRAKLKKLPENTMSEHEKIKECDKIQKGQRHLYPYCVAPDGLMKYCRRTESPDFYDPCRYMSPP